MGRRFESSPAHLESPAQAGFSFTSWSEACSHRVPTVPWSQARIRPCARPVKPRRARHHKDGDGYRLHSRHDYLRAGRMRCPPRGPAPRRQVLLPEPPGDGPSGQGAQGARPLRLLWSRPVQQQAEGLSRLPPVRLAGATTRQEPANGRVSYASEGNQASFRCHLPERGWGGTVSAHPTRTLRPVPLPRRGESNRCRKVIP